MTYKEAVRTNPTFINYPANIVELAIVNRGVEPMDEYTDSGLKNLELISADLYLEISMQPDVKEGGLSVSWDRSLLRQRARNIYLKYEDPKLSEAGSKKIDLNITKA